MAKASGLASLYSSFLAVFKKEFLHIRRDRATLITALTIPILGWVAKDTTSYGFPVSVHGPQRATDPYKPDAGDGHVEPGDRVLACLRLEQ